MPFTSLASRTHCLSICNLLPTMNPQVLQCKAVSCQLGLHCCIYYSSLHPEFGLSLWWTSRDSSHPVFLACLGCSTPIWCSSYSSQFCINWQLSGILSAMKKCPLNAAACNTIPYHWLAESICSITHKVSHEACCLYAALTAAWGLGTPVNWRATSRKTQGSRRLLQDAARWMAIILLQLTYQRVSSVTDSLNSSAFLKLCFQKFSRKESPY